MKRITLMVAICLAVAGCGPEDSKKEKVVPVGVIEVHQAQSKYSKSYIGTVTSANEHLMLSLYGGIVEKLDAKVGQKVRKNHIVAKVSAPNVHSMHKANLATLKQAEDGYARAKKVYEAGGMSEIKWMEVQTKLEQARSAAEISENSLGKCDIKAPFNGTISEVYTSLGNDIVAGSRIAMIIDENALEVSICIPENEYSNIKAGDKAVIVLTALNDLKVNGTIDNVGVNSLSISHAYPAKIKLHNYPSSLKAGMVCRVYLEVDKHERTIVPASVVKVDEKGRYIWTVGPDSLVVKKHVTIGDFVDEGIEVIKGICPGDKIIVEGVSKVSGGMKVSTKICNRYEETE